jgi:type I restriction enzyme S subunit
VSEQVYLPSGWKLTTLGEIADVIGGGTPKTNIPEYFEGGTIPWITPADLSGYTNKHISSGGRFITEEGLKNSSARMMPTGTILFTSRAPVGYVAIAANPVCTNQGFKSFVLKEGVLPDFVYWYLKGSKELAESMASGTTFLELSGAKAKQIPFPLAPLEDQKRIVAEIEKQFSRLDEAVASLKRIQTNLKRYKAAVLKAAVEGKLTEQWRKDHPDVEPADQLLKLILAERRTKWEAEELAKMKAKGIKPKDDSWKKKYKEPAGPDTANLPELPEGWVWTSTGELCDCIVPNRDKPKTFSGDIPWITLPDFEDNAINIYRSKSETGLSKEETSKYNARLIPKGSVVMSCVGRFGIVGIAQTDIVINQQLHGFLMPTEMVTGYFAYAIKTQVPYMNSISTATTIAYLNKENCNSVPIALPPIKEQKEILAEIDRRLSVTEELETTVETNLKRAVRLRQTILQQAFSGGLV